MSKPHVAVVAVHGIADQLPSESAREVASLLQRCDHGPRYSSFQETPLRIPTSPAAGALCSAPAKAESPDHEFMRQQLEGYESPHEAYETLRLAGERTERAAGARVHVYEMFWADLSRVNSGLFQILGDLYHLIFHLPHLGRQALKWARREPLEPTAGKLWRWGSKLHRVAECMLTLALPLLALIIFGTLLTLLVVAIPPPVNAYIAAGVVTLAVVALFGYLAFRNRLPGGLGAWLWLLPLVTVGGFGLLAQSYLSEGNDVTIRIVAKLLSFAWLAVALAAFLWVLGMLDRYRPGARRWGLQLGLPALIALVVLVVPSEDQNVLISRVLSVAEVELIAAGLAFLVFGVTATLAAALTFGAARCIDSRSVRRRFHRAAWTARATLGFALTFYALATVSIASAVYFASQRMLPDTTHVSLVDALIVWLFDGTPREPTPVKDFIGQFIAVAAGDGFPILVIGFLAFVIVLLWTLAPVVAHEIRPDNPHRARSGERSERLGRWLDLGLTGVPAAIDLLFFLAVFLAGVYFVSGLATALGSQLKIPGLGWTQQWILWLGSSIAASAVGLLALRSRLAPLVGSLRSGLDRALDVDNYLREHPRTFTPRARIAERYTSLLRHLVDWRGPDDQPYKAIVIVAHSQGTPITADLLRFLRRETPPELAGLMTDPAARETGLYLMTMGSPLAQVYAQAFPHLYHWMNGEPADWSEPLEPAAVESAGTGETDEETSSPAPARNDDGHGHAVTHQLTGDPAPDPRHLALDRWVNLYRSGDYVGRAFWRRPDDYPDLHRARRTSEPPEVDYTVSEDPSRSRRELCLGTGAHIHYWDKYADPVAVEIDLLIAEAIAR